MKIHKLYTFLFLLLAVTACSDDLGEVVYRPGESEPGTMDPVQSHYVLEKQRAEEVLDTFKWGKVEFNYPAAVEYIVEVDLAGKNFANPQEVTATDGLDAAITTTALNQSMNSLQQVYGFVHGVAQDVEFRVKATISRAAIGVYSNVQPSNVTSYFEYPKIFIIGDYSGWSWTNAKSQGLFSFNAETPDVFSAWVAFDGKAQNGFKITGAKDWDHGNYALDEATLPSVVEEADELSLIDDGGSKDIKVYSKNFYKFKFDKSSKVLTKEASMNSFGIAGTAVTSDIQFGFNPAEQEFVGLATLADGEIYFRADNADDLAYGLGANQGVLVKGTNGIPVTAGTYVVTVNINNPANLKYSIEEGDPLDPSLITAAELTDLDNITATEEQNITISWSALDFGDQFATDVNYAVEMVVAGSTFENPVVLAEESGLSITMTGTALLEQLKALKADIQLGESIDVDFRVKSVVTGLDAPFYSQVVTSTVVVKEEPQYPTNLYMIGEAIGGWDWSANALDMIPVTETVGKFWIVRHLEANKPFKWGPEKEWNGDFAELATNTGFIVDGGNAMVEESGLYMIFIDLVSDAITIEKAKLFGIGEAFKGWSEVLPMTIDGDKASIVAEASADIRLYASSSAGEGIDWWRMEFTVRDGEIIYRKNGGDINPATSVNANQKITLNFNTNTGVIE